MNGNDFGDLMNENAIIRSMFDVIIGMVRLIFELVGRGKCEDEMDMIPLMVENLTKDVNMSGILSEIDLILKEGDVSVKLKIIPM
mgnify:CR=1 FL=1